MTYKPLVSHVAEDYLKIKTLLCFEDHLNERKPKRHTTSLHCLAEKFFFAL